MSSNIENAELTNNSGSARLTGNGLNNQLTGNSSKNTLNGGTGNDKLNAGAGNDSLLGGAGEDILIGGLGNDSLSGGEGDDLVDYSDAVAGFATVDLSKGKASGDGSDTLISIEDVIGSEGDDIIIGSASGNELTGGLGSDRLDAGKDKVTDIFRFKTLADSNKGTERDKLFNFVSKIDDIDLSALDANKSTSGDQAFSFAGTTAKANAVWYKVADVDGVKTTTDLIVYGDSNGDAKADFEIGVVGINGLLVGDFVL